MSDPLTLALVSYATLFVAFICISEAAKRLRDGWVDLVFPLAVAGYVIAAVSAVLFIAAALATH